MSYLSPFISFSPYLFFPFEYSSHGFDGCDTREILSSLSFPVFWGVFSFLFFSFSTFTLRFSYCSCFFVISLLLVWQD